MHSRHHRYSWIPAFAITLTVYVAISLVTSVLVNIANRRFALVDLPGTYSLLSTSVDEQIARDNGGEHCHAVAAVPGHHDLQTAFEDRLGEIHHRFASRCD